MESWSRLLPLRSLLERFSTPIYVLSEAQLVSNLNAFVRVLGSPTCVAYPVKANPSISVLSILARLGCRADCSSEAEIRLAKLAGFASERILYNSPASEIKVAQRVFEAGGTVVIDSSDMLHAMDDALAGVQFPHPESRLLLRVSPRHADAYTNKQAYQQFVSHADPHGKFGIPTEELRGLVEQSRLTIHGVHVHVGTQMDHVGAYATIARELHYALDSLPPNSLPQTGRPLIVNLGGGLGIPFVLGQEYPSIEDLAGPIEGERRPSCQYWMEPGHALIGNAVGLLARVVAKKSVRGRTWAITDVGTDQLAKVTLLRWPHQVLDGDGAPLPMRGPDSLGGPLCFQGDTLVPETDVSGLAVGDPVLVQHAGAYCFALSNAFNGRSYGGMLMVRADCGGVVRVDEALHRNDNPALASHRWAAEELPLATPVPVPPERVLALSSAYLRELLPADGYHFERVEQAAPRAWRFVARVSSAADFVSLPLLLRVAADAAIVAFGLALGHDGKACPVWGSHCTVSMPQALPSSAPLVLRVSLSSVVDSDGCAGLLPKRSVVARFEVQGTAVCGSLQCVLAGEASAGTPAGPAGSIAP